MSYEYSIHFEKTSDLKNALDALRIFSLEAGLLYFKESGVIYVKDLGSSSSWKYDIALFLKESHVDVSLVGWSACLYDVFDRALDGLHFHIFDDDFGTEISLGAMFRR